MTGSVSLHIDYLRDGDDEAVGFLWQRFFPQLKLLAKRRMQGLNDPVVDEEDIAAGAFASFCRGVESGRFERVENRSDVWQVLLMLTVRKLIDQRRHCRRSKRSLVTQDRSGDLHEAIREEVDQLASQALTPDFAVLMAEQFHRLLDALPQPELRRIALMRFEGYNHSEIAAELNVVRRTVVRKLSLIREVWATLVDDAF